MRFFLAVCLSAAGTVALAQTEDAVMRYYRDFQTAVARGDAKDALRQSRAAFEAAEASWGPARRETGFLAAIYGNQLVDSGQFKKAVKIYDRCAELLANHSAAEHERLSCIVSGAGARWSLGDATGSIGAYEQAIAIGELRARQDKKAAGIVGEACLRLAEVRAQQLTRPVGTPKWREGFEDNARSQDEDSGFGVIERDALKAASLLEFANGPSDPMLARAFRIAGNSAEARRDYATASDRYERAYAIVKQIHGVEHEATRQAEGQRLFVRARKLVWEYDQNHGQDPLRRDGCHQRSNDGGIVRTCIAYRASIPYPHDALRKGQEGFVLLQYDVDRDGLVKNLRTPLSWPGGVLDERAIKAAAKWRYAPPKDENGNTTSMNDLLGVVWFRID